MLFNSYVFIFAFFPLVFFAFYRIGKYSHRLAMLWLAAASLFFYGWWDARFVGLLLGSITFNYSAAYLMGTRVARHAVQQARMLLIGAVACNLALLGYFKYANFFAENLNRFAGTTLPLGEVFLPLGISFFTFTQIAFLVDTYQGKVKEYNFIHYALFVTYFPHLIAGPVLHHKEMMPQFARRGVCTINRENFAVGLAIFVLGLATKVLLADSLGESASPIFNAAAAGGRPMLFEAWAGALSYTLQLYFDFSAYSDMAIGLSLMLNVRLPMNFNSPYKATSIIEFWRRWHMTLSRFLRDYLYIPLGGSHNGKFRRYLNLMVTMLLGGLWHGAGWTFIIWGGLHGFYLMVNHAWRALKQRLGWGDGGLFAELGSGALTFLAVVVGWVFFRADSIATAMAMLRGMAGSNGFVLGDSLPLSLLNTKHVFFVMATGLAIAWGLPNVRQLFLKYHPTCDEPDKEDWALATEGGFYRRWMQLFVWKNTTRQGLFYGVLFFIILVTMASASKSEFLYYQF